MNLTLFGHDDRYAVEQLQMSLFGTREDGAAVSSLHRGKTWLTAVTVITLEGKESRAVRRIKAAEETVRLRRQMLQQCYYRAALPLLPTAPAWGALSGVRPLWIDFLRPKCVVSLATTQDTLYYGGTLVGPSLLSVHPDIPH